MLANKRFRLISSGLTFLLPAIGIVAAFLPWYQFSVFGGSAAIAGYQLWNGKVVALLCVALSILLLVTMRAATLRPWRHIGMIVVGIVMMGVAGLYFWQVVFPAPTTIEVREGGEIAQGLAEDFVNQMNGRLGVGAPAAMVLGLVFVLLGAWEATRMRKFGD